MPRPRSASRASRPGASSPAMLSKRTVLPRVVSAVLMLTPTPETVLLTPKKG